MFKSSRRALVIAASFAIGVSAAGLPAAHAGLLDGGSSDSPSVEGLPLPVGGDLLGGLLGNVVGGGLLGGDGLLGGVLGADGLLGGALFDGGIPVVGGLLDGGLGGDGDLPIVGGLLDGGLGGDGGLLAGAGIVDALPDLGIVPGLGSVTEILQEFSASGSLVPGLQVLNETGILGILGSL